MVLRRRSDDGAGLIHGHGHLGLPYVYRSGFATVNWSMNPKLPDPRVTDDPSNVPRRRSVAHRRASPPRAPTAEAPTRSPQPAPPPCPPRCPATHRARRCRRQPFVASGPATMTGSPSRSTPTATSASRANARRRARGAARAHDAFIVGNWLDANPDWAKQLVDGGHELANHTYTHPTFASLSPDEMTAEITRCRDVLIRLTGSGGAFFRPSAPTTAPARRPTHGARTGRAGGLSRRARLQRRPARLRRSRRRRRRAAHARGGRARRDHQLALRPPGHDRRAARDPRRARPAGLDAGHRVDAPARRSTARHRSRATASE